MLYVKSVTIPAGTYPPKFAGETFEIEEDYITKIAVFFPPGHCCLTGISFWYGEWQFFPYREYEYLKGDNMFIESKLLFRCPEKPTRIRMKVYNEGKYDHTVYVYIEALNEDEIETFAKRMVSEVSGLRKALMNFMRYLFRLR